MENQYYAVVEKQDFFEIIENKFGELAIFIDAREDTPSTPILDENGHLKIITDPRGKSVCPLCKAFTLADYDKLPGDGYLCIQATKVGLFPNVEESPVSEPAFYEKLAVLYDLIYTPWETKCMQFAKEQGVMAYNGLKMLLYQGVAAYEMWNHTTVPEDVVSIAYEELLKKVK